MRTRTNPLTLGALASSFALVSGACGGAGEPFVADPEPIGAQCDIEGSERFLPIETGRAWTIRTTKLETELTEERVQDVGPLEDVGLEKSGVMAYRVTTTKDTGAVITWQGDTGTAVVRHREEDRAGMTQGDDFFFVYKTRLDESPERLVEGSTWTESYSVTSTDLATLETTMDTKMYRWDVARYGEEVTVPAGSFCALQVTRTTLKVDGTVGKTKQYWYARGVGKVKERVKNEREELVSFVVP